MCLTLAPRLLPILILAVFFWPADWAAAQDDDELRVGLVGTYVDGAGNRGQRVDHRIAFTWRDQIPDARLRPGRFSARWKGELMTQRPGKYTLLALVDGRLRISLAGKTVLDQTTGKPRIVKTEDLTMPFGWHAFEVVYEKTNDNAQVSLFWKGPGFQVEPIGRLFHEPTETADKAFQRGQRLSQALRCEACHHDQEASRNATRAADLSNLAGNINKDWLVKWLSAKHDDRAVETGVVVRRMPTFALKDEEAAALAHFLVHRDKAASAPKPVAGKKAVGRELFLSLGCLACHQLEGLGDAGLFGGGDLSKIAEKRPVGFFRQWLKDPRRLNQSHRMPLFDLSGQELNDLAAFLDTMGSRKVPGKAKAGDTDLALGKQLFASHRCTACHDKKGSEPAKHQPPKPLNRDSNWNKACFAAPSRDTHQPGYALSRSDQDALREFYKHVNEGHSAKLSGQSLLMQNNCLSCHARGESLGIRPVATKVVEAHGQLSAVLPAMSPPSLDSIGDKLHDEALRTAIQRSTASRRSWLKVRMPKFRLTDEQLATLTQHFIDQDRIPEMQPADSDPPDETAMKVAGAQLVTTGGFGCTSCHQVGKSIPPKAPLNARGPDLSMLGGRIRRQWFDRFVRNPIRIVPRMEMPTIQLPVQRLLGESLDDQLTAVWYVLNQPDFQPPRPDAVRIVSRRGDATRNERAAVLTDVIRTQESTYVKPFVVGLPNRHNVLFDLATARLASWKLGDTAHQHTEGKTWFWELGGIQVLANQEDSPDVSLVTGDSIMAASSAGQFMTEVDYWRHESGAVEFSYRLRFPGKKKDQVVATRVTQTVAPLRSAGGFESGFRRRVRFDGVPPGSAVRLSVVDVEAAKQAVISAAGTELSLPGSGQVRIRIENGQSTFQKDGSLVSSVATSDANSAEFELSYRTAFPIEASLRPTIEPTVAESVELSVVPGFSAKRLPLDESIMPTAIDWRPDGTLAIASLKGRVWLARDTNGDGLQDELSEFADELAAPYGIAAHDRHIDVVNKYALLRLTDEDADGRADRTETIASGWGHTTDYHDWVVGLPRDAAGNYYIATPCQQDKRSHEAAAYRGKVIQLAPRKPTADNPRRFALKLISGGHRFPMGIARARDGHMFVTDNQGNYNPFNELNHIIPGARYGFINLLERKDGFKPPLTAPAIDIPHPWTRSVNGICFLDTPDPVRRKLRQSAFGPFEGHLVGCEYDTRRLIRMSLEKVGGTFQGAAYPFSFDQPPSGPPLLGPLVCQVSPAGDLYVGNIRDSGWGGSNNIGSLVRLRPSRKGLPPGIAEVRATPQGFVIDFTKLVDRDRAADVANYSISSYTRVSTPQYGGSDKDRRVEKIARVKLSDDGRQAVVRLGELRADFVYEITLRNLSAEELFFPSAAYYTMRVVPKQR